MRKLLDLLKHQSFGVVSTISANGEKPHAALVAFSETEDCEIIFGTASNTRKFENIVNNPKVAFVISADTWSIQYEGVAEVLTGEDERRYRDIHLQKHPKSKKYAFQEKQKFIKVIPKWIRYMDISKDPQDVSEYTF
jgi:general stress protein 26